MTKTQPTEPAKDELGFHFEVRDGMRRVTCTIANETIDEVSGLECPVLPVLRRRAFDRMRTFIHEAAMRKLAVLPAGPSGSISLLPRDLRGMPRDARLSTRGPPARGGSGLAAGADRKPNLLGVAA